MTIKENGKVVAHPGQENRRRRSGLSPRDQRAGLLEKTAPSIRTASPTDGLQRRDAPPDRAAEHRLQRWVYEQYDHMVRTNTELLPGSDCTVLRVKGTDKRLAATLTATDGTAIWTPSRAERPWWRRPRATCLLRRGAAGVTDCLNFGNPMDPKWFWQFKECARGITRRAGPSTCR
jgi:hypothetical protein